MTLLLSVALVEQAAPIYTIEEVNVHHRFAGSLGSRLITELTLASSEGRVKITIRDTRHSRFQNSGSAFSKGSKVRIPKGASSGSISLRPDQVKAL